MNAYTAQTLAVINDYQPQGTIIDCGAGSGRLAIPLARMNYSVIAVEQSSEMCAVLQQKMTKHNLQFPVYNCSMEQYSAAVCNMALALFTVFIYCLSEEHLRAQLQTICAHILPGGFFFFDIPHESLFESQTRSMCGIQKHIRIEQTSQEHIFDYYEHCISIRKKMPFDYKEHFQIRYWPPEIFERILTACNMEFVTIIPGFDDMGADYCLWRKRE
jgi:SAM-dependent methyltransferase